MFVCCKARHTKHLRGCVGIACLLSFMAFAMCVEQSIVHAAKHALTTNSTGALLPPSLPPHQVADGEGSAHVVSRLQLVLLGLRFGGKRGGAGERGEHGGGHRCVKDAVSHVGGRRDVRVAWFNQGRAVGGGAHSTRPHCNLPAATALCPIVRTTTLNNTTRNNTFHPQPPPSPCRRGS